MGHVNKFKKISSFINFCVISLGIYIAVCAKQVVFMGSISTINSEGQKNLMLIDDLKKDRNIQIVPTIYNRMDMVKHPDLYFRSRDVRLKKWKFATIINPKIIVFSDQEMLFAENEPQVLKVLKTKRFTKKIAFIEKCTSTQANQMAHRINRLFDKVIVDDRHVLEILKRANITAPMQLIPKLINLSAYTHLPQKKTASDIFVFSVFVSAKDQYISKIRDVVTSFNQAFKSQSDVILKIHMSDQNKSKLGMEISRFIKSLGNKNIYFTDAIVTEKVFQKMLMYTDCLVNLTEVNSLNAIKARYLGLPVIEYHQIISDYKEMDVPSNAIEKVLSTQMEAIYYNYDRFLEKSRACSMQDRPLCHTNHILKDEILK